MDFEDTPREAEYRQEARGWLEQNAPPFAQRMAKLERLSEEELALTREWQACKFDAGFACLTWPKEYGGQGRPQMDKVLFEQEEARFDVPGHFLGIGLNICAPPIIHHGTEEQKQRFLPPLARGDEMWCQLFSEPGAGSDLGGLRTAARRDGDDWIVTGQKVWNTGAHLSDWAILVARHDPTLPKHKGLVFFVVDMRSEGIEARPIRQIPGSAEFNETFLNGVRIPDRQRLGEVGEGWQVAITTLMHERHGPSRIEPDVEDVMDLARDVEIDGRPALADGDVRERIADWYIQTMGVRHNYKRTLTALSQGVPVGPSSSINKVVRANERQALPALARICRRWAGRSSVKAPTRTLVLPSVS